MAKPQKENGFTPVANEILEQIVKLKLNGTQFRIILIVWRYTYGFSRKEHSLSESFISKATGISSRHIRNEIGKLINRNILNVAKEPTSRTPRKLGFNKDYDDWERGTILPEGNNPSGGEQFFRSERNNPSGLERNNPSPKKESIKENFKDTTTKGNSVDEIGNLFFELTGRFANGNDFVAISETLKKYSDLEVITKVMKSVTERKKKKDPYSKIKSFSFYIGAIEDEFKKIEAKKVGEELGRTKKDNAEDYEYDYSNILFDPAKFNDYDDEDIDF